MKNKKGLTEKIKDGILYIVLGALGIGAGIVAFLFSTKNNTNDKEIENLQDEYSKIDKSVENEEVYRDKLDKETKKQLESVDNDSVDDVVDFFNDRYGEDDTSKKE